MYNRADSRLMLSQWETSLQSNDISHWLGADLESVLNNIQLLSGPFFICVLAVFPATWCYVDLIHVHYTPRNWVWVEV